jgi:hypothetical protein
MVQTILVGLVFLAALIYLGRFIYNQVNASKRDGQCDKCLPDEQPKK